MMKHLCCIIAVISFAMPLRAQQADVGVPPILVGVGGGVQFAWHSGSVETSDGIYDCCSFTDGSGAGSAFAARALLSLSGGLSLRVGIGLEEHNADFSSVRLAYPILGSNNQIDYADLDEALAVKISTLSIEAQVQYMLLSPGLYLSAGPALHLPRSATWTHTESIAAPADLRYVNGEKSQVLLDGDIPDMSAFLSLRAGVGALIPVGGSMFVNPEMLYSFALSDVQSASSWSVSGFQLMLGVYVGL